MAYRKNTADIEAAKFAFSVKVDQLSNAGVDLKDICYGLAAALKEAIQSGPETHMIEQELIQFSHQIFDPIVYTYETKNEVWLSSKGPIRDLDDGQNVSMKIADRLKEGSHAYYEIGPLQNVFGEIGVTFKREHDL